jgi:transketolase
MRAAFINTLTELAQKDKNIYLLSTDVGFSVIEGFREKFPKRFINCGIAEQNIVGIAAGLALAGKKPYIYSIIPFIILRAIEQVRNDICYQNLDVKIVPTGAGFTYGVLGLTHFAIEDIGILRSIPNMTVLCPADPVETKELVLKSYQTKNPTFIRLHKGGEKVLYNFSPNIEIGKPSVLKEGRNGAIIGIGVSVGMGIEIVEKLKRSGFDFKLISLHTLKPIDRIALLSELKDLKAVFTIEQHNVSGGLGSAVAEILMESGFKGLFKIFGFPDKYPLEIGDTKYLEKKCGFTPEEITKHILDILKNYKK